MVSPVRKPTGSVVNPATNRPISALPHTPHRDTARDLDAHGRISEKVPCPGSATRRLRPPANPHPNDVHTDTPRPTTPGRAQRFVIPKQPPCGRPLPAGRDRAYQDLPARSVSAVLSQPADPSQHPRRADQPAVHRDTTQRIVVHRTPRPRRQGLLLRNHGLLLWDDRGPHLSTAACRQRRERGGVLGPTTSRVISPQGEVAATKDIASAEDAQRMVPR